MQAFVANEASPPPSALLSATERRRTGVAARLALIIAQHASEMAGIAPGAIPSVFATSNGDGAVVHTILEALASDQPVSPTQFHNSVHNTAAGYWSIATGSQQATTCLACHDGTAAAALLSAMAEIHTRRRPLLLCIYDLPLPAPLHARASDMWIVRRRICACPGRWPSALAHLAISYEGAPAPSGSDTPHLAALRDLAHGNPAARTLRLLEALARGAVDDFSMPLLNGRVTVRVTPCSAVHTSWN